MSQLKTRYQHQLQSIYGIEGIEFPDSLFWLGEFVLGLTEDEREEFWWSLYNLEPAGPLNYLLQLGQGISIDQIIAEYGEMHSGNIAWDSWWIDVQYYDDLPELLTCLHGAEQVSEHWGLLLDDPAVGFRGVAFCWNADATGFSTEGSILAAIASRYAQLEEDLDDNDMLDDFRESIALWQPRFDRFIRDNRIDLDDGRPTGIESDTGLSIIPTSHLSAADNDRAIELLKTGRSLWYWSGKTTGESRERLQQAHQLMKTAYELMGRYKLIEILDVVFDSRLFMLNHCHGSED